MPGGRRLQHPGLLALVVLLAQGCGGGAFVRFPDREPMQVDDDTRPFAPVPEEYVSPFAWDAADNLVFRPISRFLAVRPGAEAVNVNAMDEVPDSSWFENRIGRGELSMERMVQAACDDPPLDPAGPFTVTDAKPNGANPGFIIEDPDGRRFLLKFDSPEQPERATAADVMGSILYWAAGYFAPCDRIVYFDRSVLRIGEGATAEDARGAEVALGTEHIELALEKGESSRLPDGRYRAMSSRFLPGRPLGPWRYEEIRDDDPNDVVPHEDRRELRGGYVLASWINHFDAREQNTLAVWMSDEGSERGYVRHYMIDFGDSFGSLWAQTGLSRRLGHSYYLDFPHLAQDLVTLGAIPRPWHRNRYGPTGAVLGYFDDRDFTPDRWRPGYPNPAFGRMTELDAAWMGRIVAHFQDAHVRAVVDAARINDRLVHDELVRILIGRRDRLLRRWLSKLSPLTGPELIPAADHMRLCLRDLAVLAGVQPRGRSYASQVWIHREGRALSHQPLGPATLGPAEMVCVALPDVEGASAQRPAYLMVDVRGVPEAGPARIHLYQHGPRRYRIAGLERPEDMGSPAP